MSPEQQARRSEEGHALLLDATTTLLAADEPGERLEEVYDRLSTLIGLEAWAHLEVAHDERNVVRSWRGLSAAAWDALARLGPLPATDAPVPVEALSPRAAAILRAEGITRILAQPVMDRGRRVGTLVFATAGAAAVPADAVEHVRAIGRLVAASTGRRRAEAVLQAAEDRYRTLFESVDEGVCIFEMIFDEEDRPVDYRFLEVNPVFEEQTGLRAPMGRTARELVPDLDESWFRIYGEVALTGEAVRFVNHAPAMGRWFDVYAVRVGAPRDRQVALFFRDISGRKHREENLAFLAEINADIAVLSQESEILRVAGAKIARHLGVPWVAFSEVEAGTRQAHLLHEWWAEGEGHHQAEYDLPEYMTGSFLEELDAGRPVALADVATDPRSASKLEGYQRLGIGAQIVAPHLSGGRLKFLLAAQRRVPYAWRLDEVELMHELSSRLWLRIERARAEAALRESERRFRVMADSAPAMLWVTDTTHASIFLSRGWYAFTGQAEAEALGFGWSDAVHPEDRETAVQTFLAAAERREPFNLDFRLRRADGAWRWVIDAGRPRFDEEGRWLGYIGSVIDVHDRKLAEERLVEADRRKDHFLAVLSHELRNPLAPITTGLQILERAPGPEQARRTRQIMKRQVHQLTRLVDDLLEVTRVARDKVELRRERLDLDELARHVAEDHRAEFEEKGVAFHFRPAGKPVFVDGDWNRLTQVAGNLLHNALKFTSRGESATLSVSVDEVADRAVLRVADTGQGIDPATIGDLFEPFAQGDVSLARSGGGLGLGLALVRGLVSRHGGEVDARSEGLGRGAEFVVRLPRSRLQDAPQPQAPPPPRPGALSILVIEDSEDVAQLLAAFLELEGHEVAVASTGVEGLEKARQVRPQVVFCDIGLPGMDGYAVARAMRDDPRLVTTMRVALSGYALPEDLERAREAGFHRHLAKPADLEALREVLSEATEAFLTRSGTP